MRQLNIQQNGPYLQSSGFVNDLLIGMADGIMLPFALAAVVSLIAHDSSVVLLICALESMVLATLFGIAAYQTVVNQAEEYPAEGQNGEENRKKSFVPHLQLQQILSKLDLGNEIMEKAAQDGDQYKERWSALLSSYGLGEPAPDLPRARQNGFNVALSFLMGALLPLVPYLFISVPLTALIYSAVITFASLIIFGYIKASYTGQTPWKGALRFAITGIIVASAAFLVAYFFRV